MHTFLDEATVYVEAGAGGNGANHFRREKYVPLGGPDGGDGGKGGSVILRASRGLNTLFPFQRKRRYIADPGQPGGPQKMHGRSAKDLYVSVPIGTIIRSQETGDVLGDLIEDGQELVVVRGGKGGLGNVHFKSSTNQAPSFAEKGEPGQEKWLDLELRLIADVGIIGLPNAGKSTLLSVISAARPKIAGYPFTTLTPNLGVVDVGEDYSFVAADIPGLIEGAHLGVGLGHEFLRHVERTLVLIHVVDATADEPLAEFQQVNEELRLYDVDLAGKRQIVALNKMDLPEAQARTEALENDLRELGFEALPISAATGEGVRQLVFRAADIVRSETRERDEELDAQSVVIVVPPGPDHFEVQRRHHTFYVTGENVERLAVMTDLESDQAVYRLQARLKRMGVLTALQRAGVREGGKVRIGQVELTWTSDQEPGLK